MAPRARKSTNPKPPTVDPVSIIGFYRLGQFVRDRYKQKLAEGQPATKNSRRYVPGLAKELAKHYGIPRSTVDHARMFAGRFSLAEARKLAQLKTKSNKPLSRRHMVSLLFVSPGQAKALVAACRRKDWSAARLELEVKRLRPKKKAGGRRPRPAESGRDAVLQLLDVSQRWLHHYRTQISQSQLEKPLQGFGSLARRLNSAERELKAAVALAELRLHGPRSKHNRRQPR